MPITAFFTSLLPVFQSNVVIGGLLLLVLTILPWPLLYPRLALWGVFVSLMAGQLIRIPLPGQGGGLLLSDITVVLFELAIGWQLVTAQIRASILARRIIYIILPFTVVSLAALLLQVSSLGTSASLIAFSYWLRLATTLLLLPALITFMSEEKYRTSGLNGIVVTIVVLCVMGLAQILFFPDLTFLSRYGWDPHQGRLVSTWLDPNFFGAFLIVTLPLMVCLAVSDRRYWLWIVVILEIASLLLTHSRSSFIANLVALILISPVCILQLLRRPRSARVISIISGMGIAAVILLGLFMGLGERGSQLFREDPTTSLRWNNLQQAWSILEQHKWTGVGYNAYQFAAKDNNIITDYAIHSRSGTDNSLLNIAITTGVGGLFLFLLIWASGFQVLLVNFIREGSFKSLAGATSLLALFIHSQFLNSALYSHLLITLILIVTTSLTYSRKHP